MKKEDIRFFIRRILKESESKSLKFYKIEVELFSYSSRTTTDYETGSVGGGSSLSPISKVKVTPVLNISNPTKGEFKDFFDVDDGIDMSYILSTSHAFYDEYNTIIICQEGILGYISDGDGDCDGSWRSYYGEIVPHSKIPEWEQIKNKIKPMLTQKHIDDAVRAIGRVKQFCKNTNYTSIEHSSTINIKFLNELKKQNKIQDFKSLGDNDYYKCAIKIKDKWGLFKVWGSLGELRPILPVVFDYINLSSKYTDKDGNEHFNKYTDSIIKALRGEDIFVYSISKGIPKFIEKIKVYDSLVRFAKKIEERYIKKLHMYSNDFKGLEMDVLDDFVHAMDYVGDMEKGYWENNFKHYYKKVIEKLKNSQKEIDKI